MKPFGRSIDRLSPSEHFCTGPPRVTEFDVKQSQEGNERSQLDYGIQGAFQTIYTLKVLWEWPDTQNRSRF